MESIIIFKNFLVTLDRIVIISIDQWRTTFRWV